SEPNFSLISLTLSFCKNLPVPSHSLQSQSSHCTLLLKIPQIGLAAIFCSLSLATASIDCLSNVTYNQLGSFSGAPITFKVGLLNATACGQYCEKTKKCEASSYVGGGESNVTSRSDHNAFVGLYQSFSKMQCQHPLKPNFVALALDAEGLLERLKAIMYGSFSGIRVWYTSSQPLTIYSILP
ncbi:hypothetical protein GB937_001503, partial [Aspergillus fischeri]